MYVNALERDWKKELWCLLCQSRVEVEILIAHHDVIKVFGLNKYANTEVDDNLVSEHLLQYCGQIGVVGVN